MTTLKAVLFDLDGTLVHSAPDITVALNAALAMQQLQPVSETQVLGFVGRGARALVERALAAQGKNNSTLVATVLDHYVRKYKVQLATLSTPLPGAQECLRHLARRGLKLAVVTNALQEFAQTILERMELSEHVDFIVGGDRLRVGKPHPAPLLFACSHFSVLPNETLMVGDSANDIEAARAAGCDVVCVHGGYTGDHPLSELDCELIDSLTMLPEWIDRRFPRSLRRTDCTENNSSARF